MTFWSLPRLSTEWIGPIVVTRNGTPVIGWKLGLFPRTYQPASVTEISETPSNLDGGYGVLVGPGTSHVLTPGLYRIWIRYVDVTEAPVLSDVGTIQIV